MRCKIPERDLVQRLDHTFCRYNDEPYLVRVDGTRILLLDIASKRTVNDIRANDIMFDISSIPLGYYQYRTDGVVYLSRQPARIFKQGVSADNLAYHYPNDIPLGRVSLYTTEFVNMIKGIYPSLEATLDIIRNSNDPIQRAISRDIALLSNDGSIVIVHYKNREVGWIPPRQQVVVVPSMDNAWVISRYLSEFKWEIR